MLWKRWRIPFHTNETALLRVKLDWIRIITVSVLVSDNGVIGWNDLPITGQGVVLRPPDSQTQ